MSDTRPMADLCRLCGSEDGIKVNIFEVGEKHANKINKILCITVNEHDLLPKTMCHRCSFKVNDFYQFILICKRTQELFMSRMKLTSCTTNSSSSKDSQKPNVTPLISVNCVSSSIRCRSDEPEFIDENDALIVIDDEDDSPQSTDKDGPHQIVALMTTSTNLKNKLKPPTYKKSFWKARKRRHRDKKPCRIAEVFTTTADQYEGMAGENVENDPLGDSSLELNKNNNYSNKQNSLNKTNKMSPSNSKTKNFGSDKKEGILMLPQNIVVTHIPGEGPIYTCESCGRTFITAQPANLHQCNNNIRSVGGVQDTSTNWYNCNECNQAFSRHSQLIAHSKCHVETVSSSDENTKTVMKKKRFRRRNYKNAQTLTNCTFMPNVNSCIIIKHSLLSSESDAE